MAWEYVSYENNTLILKDGEEEKTLTVYPDDKNNIIFNTKELSQAEIAGIKYAIETKHPSLTVVTFDMSLGLGSEELVQARRNLANGSLDMSKEENQEIEDRLKQLDEALETKLNIIESIDNEQEKLDMLQEAYCEYVVLNEGASSKKSIARTLASAFGNFYPESLTILLSELRVSFKGKEIDLNEVVNERIDYLIQDLEEQGVEEKLHDEPAVEANLHEAPEILQNSPAQKAELRESGISEDDESLEKIESKENPAEVQRGFKINKFTPPKALHAEAKDDESLEYATQIKKTPSPEELGAEAKIAEQLDLDEKSREKVEYQDAPEVQRGVQMKKSPSPEELSAEAKKAELRESGISEDDESLEKIESKENLAEVQRGFKINKFTPPKALHAEAKEVDLGNNKEMVEEGRVEPAKVIKPSQISVEEKIDEKPNDPKKKLGVLEKEQGDVSSFILENQGLTPLNVNLAKDEKGALFKAEVNFESEYVYITIDDIPEEIAFTIINQANGLYAVSIDPNSIDPSKLELIKQSLENHPSISSVNIESPEKEVGDKKNVVQLDDEKFNALQDDEAKAQQGKAFVVDDDEAKVKQGNNPEEFKIQKPPEMPPQPPNEALDEKMPEMPPKPQKKVSPSVDKSNEKSEQDKEKKFPPDPNFEADFKRLYIMNLLDDGYGLNKISRRAHTANKQRLGERKWYHRRKRNTYKDAYTRAEAAWDSVASKGIESWEELHANEGVLSDVDGRLRNDIVEIRKRHRYSFSERLEILTGYMIIGMFFPPALLMGVIMAGQMLLDNPLTRGVLKAVARVVDSAVALTTFTLLALHPSNLLAAGIFVGEAVATILVNSAISVVKGIAVVGAGLAFTGAVILDTLVAAPVYLLEAGATIIANAILTIPKAINAGLGILAFAATCIVDIPAAIAYTVEAIATYMVNTPAIFANLLIGIANKLGANISYFPINDFRGTVSGKIFKNPLDVASKGFNTIPNVPDFVDFKGKISGEIFKNPLDVASKFYNRVPTPDFRNYIGTKSKDFIKGDPLNSALAKFNASKSITNDFVDAVTLNKDPKARLNPMFDKDKALEHHSVMKDARGKVAEILKEKGINISPNDVPRHYIDASKDTPEAIAKAAKNIEKDIRKISDYQKPHANIFGKRESVREKLGGSNLSNEQVIQTGIKYINDGKDGAKDFIKEEQKLNKELDKFNKAFDKNPNKKDIKEEARKVYDEFGAKEAKNFLKDARKNPEKAVAKIEIARAERAKQQQAAAPEEKGGNIEQAKENAVVAAQGMGDIKQGDDEKIPQKNNQPQKGRQ